MFSDASVADDLRKHDDKRWNCSWWVIPILASMFSTLSNNFTSIKRNCSYFWLQVCKVICCRFVVCGKGLNDYRKGYIYIYIYIYMSCSPRKPTLWTAYKVSTQISLSMPHRLTRTDTFHLLLIFCFRNHFSIPLSPGDWMCWPRLACADCTGLSWSIYYAESIMSVFS